MLLIPKIIILKSVFPFLAFLIAREMVRKFLALYKAGQQKEIWRFTCIFIFNTFGLLPIIYLLVDSTKEETIEAEKNNNKITTNTKDTKKFTKGGVTTWESAKSTKKSKITSSTGTKKTKKKELKK